MRSAQRKGGEKHELSSAREIRKDDVSSAQRRRKHEISSAREIRKDELSSAPEIRKDEICSARHRLSSADAQCAVKGETSSGSGTLSKKPRLGSWKGTKPRWDKSEDVV